MQDGPSPLWIASCYGHLAYVTVLISAGADVNTKKVSL